MKKIISVFTFLTLALAYANSSYSQSEEEMQKWMEYMTPGPMHEGLAHCVGEWKANTTMWMYPGADPITSEGTASAEMIFGGRYLQMKYKSSFMGMPFEGMSIDGYDNATKVFNSVWIDNLGTGIYYSSGTMNEDNTKINYTGSMVDPVSGEMITMRQSVQLHDDGTMTFEMFKPFEGVEFKTMQVDFTK